VVERMKILRTKGWLLPINRQIAKTKRPYLTSISAFPIS